MTTLLKKCEKFKIFVEPQKFYLRICVIYILIILGEIEKKDDFMPGDQTEITAVSV
jgi:hypothetical protein